MNRSPPLGIIILAILEIIAGLGWLGLASTTFLAAGAAAAFPILGVVFGGALIVLAAVMFLIGVFSFLLAWGLWTGRPWARTAAIILAVLGIIVALFSLPGSFIALLINILIIFYLTRPHVKAYFR